MRIKSFELSTKLEQDLPSVIWISGDEPLSLQEASQLYLDKAKSLGFNERETVYVDGKFNFNTLHDLSGNLSLFGDKKIIILKLETIKLGRNSSLLIDWLEKLPPDVNVLMQSAKLDAAMQKTKWFKQVETLAWIVQVWPVEIDKLPNWILQRAKAQNLKMDIEAAEILALQVEGNLLAAKQEIDKLALIYDAQEISAAIILKSVSDSSHYDVFQLADSVLQDKPDRTIKIFRGLMAEGVALQVVIWAIAKDLRELISIKLSGTSMAAYKHVEYMHPVIWRKRMPVFTQALDKNSYGRFRRLLQNLSLIDKASKGLAQFDANLAMERLFIAMYNGDT